MRFRQPLHDLTRHKQKKCVVHVKPISISHISLIRLWTQNPIESMEIQVQLRSMRFWQPVHDLTRREKNCRAYTPFKQTSQAEGSHLIAFSVRQAACKNNHCTPVLHTGKRTQWHNHCTVFYTCSRWPPCCLQDGLATWTTVYRLMPQNDLPDKIPISFMPSLPRQFMCTVHKTFSGTQRSMKLK